MSVFRFFFLSITGLLLTGFMLVGAAVADRSSTLPFVSQVFAGRYVAREVASLPSWRHVLAKLDTDARRVARCQSDAGCRDIAAKPMAALVSHLPSGSPRALIEQVNRHFNSFPYVSDRKGGRYVDHWLSPIEFIQTSGDCEDYAIAKYFVLRLMGVPDERMWIVLVRDERRQLDHAVLLVDVGADTLVLDNLAALADWSRFPHYKPMYAFNGQATWRLVDTASAVDRIAARK